MCVWACRCRLGDEQNMVMRNLGIGVVIQWRVCLFQWSMWFWARFFPPGSEEKLCLWSLPSTGPWTCSYQWPSSHSQASHIIYRYELQSNMDTASDIWCELINIAGWFSRSNVLADKGKESSKGQSENEVFSKLKAVCITYDAAKATNPSDWLKWFLSDFCDDFSSVPYS